jgi:hypothetical protein
VKKMKSERIKIKGMCVIVKVVLMEKILLIHKNLKLKITQKNIMNVMEISIE